MHKRLSDAHFRNPGRLPAVLGLTLLLALGCSDYRQEHITVKFRWEGEPPGATTHIWAVARCMDEFVTLYLEHNLYMDSWIEYDIDGPLEFVPGEELSFHLNVPNGDVCRIFVEARPTSEKTDYVSQYGVSRRFFPKPGIDWNLLVEVNLKAENWFESRDPALELLSATDPDSYYLDGVAYDVSRADLEAMQFRFWQKQPEALSDPTADDLYHFAERVLLSPNKDFQGTVWTRDILASTADQYFLLADSWEDEGGEYEDHMYAEINGINLLAGVEEEDVFNSWRYLYVVFVSRLGYHSKTFVYQFWLDVAPPKPVAWELSDPAPAAGDQFVLTLGVSEALELLVSKVSLVPVDGGAGAPVPLGDAERLGLTELYRWRAAIPDGVAGQGYTIEGLLADVRGNVADFVLLDDQGEAVEIVVSQ